MIQATITYRCRACDSEDIVKNGKNRYGKQQFKCKACGKQAVLSPSVKYSQERREEILAAYKERPSMRGIQRIYGVSRATLSKWLKKVRGCGLQETLMEPEAGDVLELDEVWSFVHKKERKRWLWTAMCRRTRQIGAFVIGDHSARTCAKLWRKLPEATSVVTALVTYGRGRLTPRSFPSKPTAVSAKQRARLTTWSAGTTRLDSALPVTFAKPSPSPSLTLCITLSLSGSSLSTIVIVSVSS